MGTLDVRRRVAPGEGEDRHPLLDAEFDLLGLGQGQDEVDAEGPVGQLPHAPDQLPQQRGRVDAEGDQAQAAGVADRRRQLGAGDVRSHGGGEDGHVEAQQVAQPGSEHMTFFPWSGHHPARRISADRRRPEDTGPGHEVASREMSPSPSGRSPASRPTRCCPATRSEEPVLEDDGGRLDHVQAERAHHAYLRAGWLVRTGRREGHPEVAQERRSWRVGLMAVQSPSCIPIDELGLGPALRASPFEPLDSLEERPRRPRKPPGESLLLVLQAEREFGDQGPSLVAVGPEDQGDRRLLLSPSGCAPSKTSLVPVKTRS